VHAPNHSGEAKHVSPSVYWRVGIILAVLTALEVGVVYVDALKGYVAFLLLLIGALKFALVAMYFMHLKFDSPVYSRFFAGGIALAVVLALAVVAIVQSNRIAEALLRSHF